jgi:hypothetical protein
LRFGFTKKQAPDKQKHDLFSIANSQKQSPTKMSLFLSTVTAAPCLALHVQALHNEPDQYLAGLRAQLQNDDSFKSLSSSQIAIVAVACHITGHHQVVESVLDRCSIVEIQKMLTLLSRPSQQRQLVERINKIETVNPHLTKAQNDKEISRKRKRGKIVALRSKLHKVGKELDLLYIHGHHQGSKQLLCEAAHTNSAVAELIRSSSCSGSLARKVRNWARKLKPDYLEFVMLEMPKLPWIKVADFVHFRPQDFAVSYFLADVFGGKIPEDSFVYAMRELDDAPVDKAVDLFTEAAERYPQVYKAYASFRLKTIMHQSREIAEDFAQHMPLDTLIWYFEELYEKSHSVSKILAKRLRGPAAFKQLLQKDSKLSGFGKLLERVLMFQRTDPQLATHLMEVASERLNQMVEKFQGTRKQGKRIAVFGDASASMQTAIEASTIFASMASACLDGELSFFASDLIQSPYAKPSTVKETMQICQSVNADGCTSLAAALWPYFDQQIIVDAIVLVTDEGENTECNGYSFADLLREYKETVNPQVALVIICVGSGEEEFRDSLTEHGIKATTVTIDEGRPDLTKYDALLTQVATAAGVEIGGIGPKLEEFVIV